MKKAAFLYIITGIIILYFPSLPVSAETVTFNNNNLPQLTGSKSATGVYFEYKNKTHSYSQNSSFDIELNNKSKNIYPLNTQTRDRNTSYSLDSPEGYHNSSFSTRKGLKNNYTESTYNAGIPIFLETNKNYLDIELQDEAGILAGPGGGPGSGSEGQTGDAGSFVGAPIGNSFFPLSILILCYLLSFFQKNKR